MQVNSKGHLYAAGRQTVKAEAKVIADAATRYRVVILSPAAPPAHPPELTGRGNGAKSRSPTPTGWADLTGGWRAQITRQWLRTAGEGAKGGKAEMKRVDRKTPPWAISPRRVRWFCSPLKKASQQSARGPTRNGFVIRTAASRSIAAITDHGRVPQLQLHLEFCVPFLPAARGQSRGNSGVLLHGRYNIQV